MNELERGCLHNYTHALSVTHGKALRVIGWYHSHPHITVFPSHVGACACMPVAHSPLTLGFDWSDVQTQAMYQQLDQDFVGLIFACYSIDKHNVCVLCCAVLCCFTKYLCYRLGR